MTRRPLRTVALLAASMVGAAAGLVVAPGVASAGSTGTITSITPNPGTTGINPTLVTSGLCPNDANANARVQVFLSGPNIPAQPTAAGLSVVGVSNVTLYNGSGTNYEIPLSNTLEVIASLNGFTYQVGGAYTLTAVCRTSTLPTDLGNFDGIITFTSASTYVSGGVVVTPPPAIPAIPVATATPVVTGAVGVDNAVSCTNVVFSNASSISYAWFIAGQPVPGATASTYIPAASALGKTLSCSATASNAAGSAVSVSSTFIVGKGLAIKKLTGAKIKLPRGKSKASKGKKVALVMPKWNVPGVKVTVQWTRNGSVIKGATKSSYVPTSKDVGKKLGCVIKAVKVGHDVGKTATLAVRVV